MGYLFTSECVSDGHPDKIADQISDAILDNILAFDPDAKVACETLVTTGQVVVAGEVSTTAYVDIQEIVRKTIRDIGYTNPEYMFDGNSCGVLSAIHEQSPDIQRGVDKETKENQGAGDQGMVFGYACNETKDYIPLSLYLARKILQVLKEVKDGHTLMSYLRPDAKSQVTVEYEGNKPVAVSTIVVSTQHDPFGDDEKMRQNIIRNDILRYVIPKALHDTGVNTSHTEYLINPTGNFVIGGPHGDTGLTGRNIIVDTYGGKGAHGGGAFSGKDPSKVDRSGAYMARYIAKNMVAAGVADEMLVQISYAIGVAEPVSIYVNTYGRSNVSVPDEGIAQIIGEMFDLRPYAIEKALGLRNPIYLESASYGHMGREPKVVKKRFESRYGEGTKEVEVCLFSWEALDKVDLIREKFGI